jgi:hypothetical protein
MNNNIVQANFRIPAWLLKKAKTCALHADITLNVFLITAIEEAVNNYTAGETMIKKERKVTQHG